MMNLWDNLWIRGISPPPPKIKPFARSFCAVMPGLATVAQPQIHAAHARQQGQAGRFAGWTAKDHPTPRPARYTGRIEDAGDHAPRNQTRHKPRQSRILARRCAFRLVSQWETDHALPTQSDTETGQIP